MSKTRNNHYVPKWYQRGFLSKPSGCLYYRDLAPEQKENSAGKIITVNDYFKCHVSRCFCKRDLYTTFAGSYINDEIERKFFGAIDQTGSEAVRAFITEEPDKWHQNFKNFFEYLDAQKIRTPKGLDWINSHYPDLDQNHLMQEMQVIRNMHCSIWTGGVREIVKAGESELKFILSDHPVTVYNCAILPSDRQNSYPHDPPITLKGSQTIFPLDKNNCLILTNYEFANNPDKEDAMEKITHAKYFRNCMVSTDAFIRSRSLRSYEVLEVNYIIKERACRFIAATEKEALYPERYCKTQWADLRKVILPPKHELGLFGGEIFATYEDGRKYYQDAFGRSMPETKYHKKTRVKNEPKPNEFCGCCSGKKYKNCCMNKSESDRPSWDVLSIRERNLILYEGVIDILGLNEGKLLDDIRKEISVEQVKKIHDLYGFLWPLDADIFSLLPKPDKSSRALYTGILHPKLIRGLAVSSSLYFDEIIIQHPFINPFTRKPEHNPVEVPHKFKQQTLSNVYLLFELIPYIEAGFINLIPELCVFDDYLQRQMLDMARARCTKSSLSTRDSVLISLLTIDQTLTHLVPSDEHQLSQLRQIIPDASERMIKETLQYLHQMEHDDPFTLLQENMFSKNKGQIFMMELVPNFEMTMYLAQVTGAIVLTDSDSRWKEINMPLNIRQNSAEPTWEELTILIDQFEYFMFANVMDACELRCAGKFSRLRKLFRELFNEIKNGSEQSKVKISSKRLKLQLNDAYKVSKNEISGQYHQTLSSKMKCVAPYGGFVNNNVQRMLLMSGSSSHLKCVPAAIYMDVVLRG